MLPFDFRATGCSSIHAFGRARRSRLRATTLASRVGRVEQMIEVADRSGRFSTPLLLRDVADPPLPGLGVLVAALQLVSDPRRDSAFRGIGLDIFHHFQFGLAEICD